MGPSRTLLLALGMVLATQAEEDLPPLTYSAKPVQGVVVDAGTGEPLEGVIIVAQWILDELGKGPWRRLHVFETTTDAKGNYLIPGWGPKENTWYPWTRLRDEDPALSFFKRGYIPHYAQNRWERNESVRFSEWDGKTIKLNKFRGTDDDWIKKLSLLQTSLSWGSEVMQWQHVPRITLVLEEERLMLVRHPLTVSYLSPLSTLGTTVEEVRHFLERQK